MENKTERVNSVHNHEDRPLGETLWEMRLHNDMCDVTIKTKDCDVTAHGVVLGATSSFLKCLVLNLRNEGTPVIKIPHFPESVCVRVLEYAYTGKLSAWSGTEEEQHLVNELIDLWKLGGIKKGKKSFFASTLVDQFSQTGEESGVCYEEDKSKGEVSVKHELVSSDTDADNAPDTYADLAGDEDLTLDMVQEPENLSLNCEEISQDKDDVLDSEIGDKKVRVKRRLRRKNSHPMRISKQKNLNATLQDPTCTENLTSAEDQPGRKRIRRRKTAKPKKIPRQSAKLKAQRGEDEKMPRRKKAKIKHEDPDDNKPQEFNCKECGLTFPNRSELQVHKRQTHIKPTKSCRECKMRFLDRNSLLAHNFSHHFEEGMAYPTEYRCEEEDCSYKTFSSVNFNVHKRKIHLAHRPVCDICGKTYKHAWSLHSHMQTIHPAEGRKSHTCHICNKVIQTHIGLKNHLKKIHELGASRPKQICPHCGYTCWADATLNEHLFVKHGVHPKNGKTYKCKYCDYEVVNASTLKKHEQRHNADRSFKCHLCDKTYVALVDLNKHIRTVHIDSVNIKVHHCPFCDYSSKWSMSAVRDHIQCKHTESNEKKWGCTECSYRSNVKGNLVKHMRNVHKRTVKTNWTLPKVSVDKDQTSHGQITNKSLTELSGSASDLSKGQEEDGLLIDMPQTSQQQQYKPQQEQREQVAQQQLPQQCTDQQQHSQNKQQQQQQQQEQQHNAGLDQHFQQQQQHQQPPMALQQHSQNSQPQSTAQHTKKHIEPHQQQEPQKQQQQQHHQQQLQLLSPVSLFNPQGTLPSPYNNNLDQRQGYIQDGVPPIINPMFLHNYNFQQ